MRILIVHAGVTDPVLGAFSRFAVLNNAYRPQNQRIAGRMRRVSILASLSKWTMKNSASATMRNEAKITSENSRHNFAQIFGTWVPNPEPAHFNLELTNSRKKTFSLSGMAIFSHGNVPRIVEIGWFSCRHQTR
jgi:hypothetical protein